MIYNFDTNCRDQATAALVVYAIYRSRNKSRFKTSVDMWGQIERFIKSAAKRAQNIQQFMNNLMPKMCTETIHPKWVEVAVTGRIIKIGNEYAEFNQDGKRQFLTQVLADCDQANVIDFLRNETTFVVMLVRDRLEQEKPIENTFAIDEEEII